MKYAVETLFTYGWENCWQDETGKPEHFETYDEAEQSMKDHIIDCINAVEDGHMEDSPDPSELRVVEVPDA